MSLPINHDLQEECMPALASSPGSAMTMELNTPVSSVKIEHSDFSDEMRGRSCSWPVAPPVASALSAVALAMSPTLQLQQNQAQAVCLQMQAGTVATSPAATSPSSMGKAKKSPRRNPWGSESYADLISKAILSTNDKRMTLNQIYEWMVDNVSHFKDKGDSNSAAGWKNSVRHNLSLHPRFIKVPNEQTGKSSWWMINPEAKGKHRRRTASIGGEFVTSPGRPRRVPPGGRTPKKGKCGKLLKDDGTPSSLTSSGSPFSPPPHLSSPLLDSPLAANSPGIGVVDSPLLQDEFDPSSPLSATLFMAHSPSSYPSVPSFDLEPGHHSMVMSGSEGSNYDGCLAPDLMLDQDDQCVPMPALQLTTEDGLGGALQAMNLQPQPDSVPPSYRACFQPILTPVTGTPWDTPFASAQPTPHHTPPVMARHQHLHSSVRPSDPYFDLPSQQQQQQQQQSQRARTESGSALDSRVHLGVTDRPLRRSVGPLPSSSAMPSRERSVSEPCRPCSSSSGDFAMNLSPAEQQQQQQQQQQQGNMVATIDDMSPPPLTAMHPSHSSQQAAQQEKMLQNQMMLAGLSPSHQQQQLQYLAAESYALPPLTSQQPPGYHGNHTFVADQDHILQQAMLEGYAPQEVTMAMQQGGLLGPDALMPYLSSIPGPQYNGVNPFMDPVELQRALLNGEIPKATMDAMLAANQFPAAVSPNASVASSHSADIPMQLEFNFEHFSPEPQQAISGGYPQQTGRTSSTGSAGGGGGSGPWFSRRVVT